MPRRRGRWRESTFRSRPVGQAGREADRTARDADAVLAVGGGSAIGLAKAVALSRPVRVLCVPTTYSGSEMTPVYGIVHGITEAHDGRQSLRGKNVGPATSACVRRW